MYAFEQALLEGGGCLVGALGRRHLLRGGVVVMHHGGNTVAHSSFVAPVRETRKEQGWRRQSGLVCGFYCCCKTLSAHYGNDHAPLEPHGLHPQWMVFPDPQGQGMHTCFGSGLEYFLERLLLVCQRGHSTITCHVGHCSTTCFGLSCPLQT